jgi:hypothetical protein
VSSRLFLRCLPFVVIAVIAACSERLDTGQNCPVLCQSNALVFRDTSFEIVQFDSSYGGFTGLGERWPAPGLQTLNGNSFQNESFVPAINRPDSVDVRMVFRFDTLANTLSATDTTKITALQLSRLLLVVDTSRSVIPAGSSTVDLYDVDDSTVANDTSDAVLSARFVPSRLIASRTFTRDEILADTISGTGAVSTIRAFTVPIADTVMLRFVTKARRLRIGVRVRSASSIALRFVSPSTNAASLVPRLSYDPSPDTAVKAWEVFTRFRPVIENAPERFRAQTLIVRDRTTPLNDGSLETGGLIGTRGLMKVRIPRSFLDTVTVVRATLDMTQRPQRTVPGATDGVRVRLRVAIAGTALGSDPRRLVELLDPTIENVLLNSLRLRSADSGVKSFDVAPAIRVWQAQDSSLATALVLYSEGETFQEQRPAFYSRRNSNPALRPRLRITYTTRREGAIP